MKAGTRLRSAVCTTEVIVVKAPASDVGPILCGGSPMVEHGKAVSDGASLDPAAADGTAVGKRYGDRELGLELLCTKAGAGSLALAGGPLAVLDAKHLPASD